jgi:hypothetical protein
MKVVLPNMSTLSINKAKETQQDEYFDTHNVLQIEIQKISRIFLTSQGFLQH